MSILVEIRPGPPGLLSITIPPEGSLVKALRETPGRLRNPKEKCNDRCNY